MCIISYLVQKNSHVINVKDREMIKSVCLYGFMWDGEFESCLALTAITTRIFVEERGT